MPGSGRGQSKVLAEPRSWGSGGGAGVKPHPGTSAQCRHGWSSRWGAMWTSAPLASQQGAPVPVLFSGPCSQLRVGFGPSHPHKPLGLRCEQRGVSSSRHEDGFWCGQAAHWSPSDSDNLHTGPGAPGQLSSLHTNPGGCGHHCRPPPGFSKLTTSGQVNSVFL